MRRLYKPDELVNEVNEVLDTIHNKEYFPDYITIVPDGEYSACTIPIGRKLDYQQLWLPSFLLTFYADYLIITLFYT